MRFVQVGGMFGYLSVHMQRSVCFVIHMKQTNDSYAVTMDYYASSW